MPISSFGHINLPQGGWLQDRLNEKMNSAIRQKSCTVRFFWPSEMKFSTVTCKYPVEYIEKARCKISFLQRAYHNLYGYRTVE